jgi:excisionase family DNA binding protein
MSKSTITIQEARNRASVSPAELACLTGLAEITVYRKVKAGDIPSVKLGGRRLIPASFFMQLLEADQ